ncbi:MAG: TOBE domain-containing protein [Mailhella sp.]|nr:TOBE domain-containing protein [Mailhella sp.]
MIFASRDVFPATVTAINTDSPYSEVEVTLPSGLCLYAELASPLLEKLELAVGREATLAVKASHVSLSAEDTALCCRNMLHGRIVGMTYGFSNAHAIIETASGNRICVNLPLDVHPSTWLDKNSVVTAWFDSHNVFIFAKKQA